MRLILQGGGALGAYQAGVYQAASSRTGLPAYRSGRSIPRSLLENRLERRVERLRNFWEHITDRKIWGFTANGDFFRKVREEDG